MPSILALVANTDERLPAIGERIAAAWTKVRQTRNRPDRSDWVEASLELATAWAEAHACFSSNHDFKAWRKANGHDHKAHHTELLALISWGSNPTLARTVLERTPSYSYEVIWRHRMSEAERAECAVLRGSPRSPANKRQRGPIQRPTPPRRLASFGEGLPRPQAMTVEEHRRAIDPEFTGDAHDWARRYGHVQTRPAERIARDDLGHWAHKLRAGARTMQELGELVRPIDLNWLRNPGERDVNRLREALGYLRVQVAEAEVILAHCEATLARAREDQPVTG